MSSNTVRTHGKRKRTTSDALNKQSDSSTKYVKLEDVLSLLNAIAMENLDRGDKHTESIDEQFVALKQMFELLPVKTI